MARKKRAFQFRQVHFFIVLTISVCVLAGMIIPQYSNLRQANDLLAQRERELAEIRLRYERESNNLEFMKTNTYKLQMGSEKYGWHYEDDVLIRDNFPLPTPNETQGTAPESNPSSGTPIPTLIPVETATPHATYKPMPTFASTMPPDPTAEPDGEPGDADPLPEE